MSAPNADADRGFLREAIALGERGRFAVEPNPAVGCVIVRSGRVIARGWHRAYGGPHAEVEAIRRAGRRTRGATVYVSLEPCSTHGKTPPCTEALVRAGVARVVWAVSDPSPANGGRAARVLSRAGVEVTGGRLPREGVEALGAFGKRRPASRPWVILKWAMSLDGRIAPSRGVGARLVGPKALTWVHELRGRVEAVAVGRGTVETDDPRLTCRLPGGPPEGRGQPLRVVFDSALRTPLTAALVMEASASTPVLFACARARSAHAAALKKVPGVLVLEAPGADSRVDLKAALRWLYRRGVRRMLVEGGSTLAGQFLREGLVDQAAIFAAPIFLGADGAPPALANTAFTDLLAAPRLDPFRVRRLGDDVLIEGYVRRPS